MRDLWDTSTPQVREFATKPKKLAASGIKRLIERAIWAQGLRKKLENGKKRHPFQAIHCFRKWFKTRCETAGMRPNNIEKLLSRSIGISNSYYRPTETDLLDDFLKVSDLLQIDQQSKLQKDFTLNDAPAQIPGTLQTVPFIHKMVNYYREQNFPVFHVIRLYQEDGSNVDLCRRKIISENKKQMVIVGTNGAEIVDKLKPSSDIKLDFQLLLSGSLQQIGQMEWIMYKPRWGAFYNTLLEKHLHYLDVNTVVVCGCIFQTVLELRYMKQVKETLKL